jgi:hypothetical protein
MKLSTPDPQEYFNSHLDPVHLAGRLGPWPGGVDASPSVLPGC